MVPLSDGDAQKAQARASFNHDPRSGKRNFVADVELTTHGFSSGKQNFVALWPGDEGPRNSAVNEGGGQTQKSFHEPTNASSPIPRGR
jgi:hypothetical protein